MKKIYFDYAATTPVDPRVVEVMLPYFTDKFGNSVSLHQFGREVGRALKKSREVISRALEADPKEIIFTSSATESNNTVLKGIAFANKDKGNNIIVSSIEHDCLMNGASWLEKQGFEITKLAVNKYGLVDPDDVKKSIKKETILVSVMHANNEIGTIQPISQIGKICRQKGVYFHTDAAQTFGKIPINVNRMNIDLLTASSHKMYGPKGVALLYIRQGLKMEPLLHGGGHEFGLRSSTVNVPLVVGFAKTVKLCQKEMGKERKRLTKLRDKLIKGVLKRVSNSYLNGHSKKRLPNNVNVRFSFVEGESILMRLDSLGIAVSTGSACSSKDLQPSHVLKACRLQPEEIHGSIRMSLGKWTTEKEIDYVLRVLPKVVKNLRKMSPFSN